VIKSTNASADKPVLKVTCPDGSVVDGPLSFAEVLAKLQGGTGGAGEAGEGSVIVLGNSGDPCSTALLAAPLCAQLTAKTGRAVARIINNQKVSADKPVLKVQCAGKQVSDSNGLALSDVFGLLNL
jgi:hypothetical protein